METRHTSSTTVARPVAPRRGRKAERPPEKPVDFSLNLPQARQAAVAGTFNGWDWRRNAMRRDDKAGWTLTIWLPPGRYEYRFVADGQWLSDPSAKQSVPNGHGSTNSVLVVD